MSEKEETEELVDEESPTPELEEPKPKPKRKTKANLQAEVKELQQQLEIKDKALSKRAYTVTSGTDETVPIGELKAITLLFPEFPLVPTQREIGETIRPHYTAALARLKKLAGL